MEDLNNKLGHHNLKQCCQDFTWTRVINGVVKQSLLDHVYETKTGMINQLNIRNPNKMAVILLKNEHHWKTENHWKTKRHWKTEQKATIGIPNAFNIPAPTVIVWMVYMGFYRNYKCCLSHFLYLLNWR